MPEAIGKPNFSANKDTTIELEKVPLIGSAGDVVVVKHSFRCADTVDKCAAKISGIHAARESEYRLLEIGLISQFERSEKIGIVGFRIFGNAPSGCCMIWEGRLVGNEFRGSA